MASKILVPLDGSELAEQALPCAVMLARGLPAELVLMRAVSLPSDVRELLDNADLEPAEPLERLQTEAASYLGRVASRLEQEGLRVHQVVLGQPAAEAIVDYAGQAEIQQIVMATHGYAGISRWVHGSVAERVIQSAGVPVLLVRAREKAPDVALHVPLCQRILVPLDGSPIAEQVLPVVVSIAQALKAQVTLFQVPIVFATGSLIGEWYLPLQGVFETAHQEGQAYLDGVADRLQAQGLEVSSVLEMGAVADAIVNYAEANQVDLIAMCTHGRTGLARWTLGSVADRVLRAGRVPLLLVRAQ
jgi:nucleotide-binding universal stress UspA family protein